MYSLALTVARWVVRGLISLAVIVFILWAGAQAKKQFDDLIGLESSLQYLKNGATSLREEIKALEKNAEQSAAQLKTSSLAQLDQRMAVLSKQVSAKTATLQELDTISNTLNPAKRLDVAKLRIELAVANQELEYLRYLREVRFRESELRRIEEDCERIGKTLEVAEDGYQAATVALDGLNATASIHAKLNPFSSDFKERERLEAQRKKSKKLTDDRKTEHEQCLTTFSRTKRNHEKFSSIRDFVLNSAQTSEGLKELQAQMQGIQQVVDSHWFKPVVLDPVRQLLPTALAILCMVILVPLAIKLCLFYFLAPIASRQRPICLLPGSCVSTPIPDKTPSAVSLLVNLNPDSELVLLPEYFHSAPEHCTTEARQLLNGRYRLTSLAAGMYNVTAVRCDQPSTVKISSGHDSLNELLLINIADGEAVSLRPRNLVGVIQPRNAPVRMTRHWCLGSLQAWLTMQLRYLVFHGPAQLVVRGCRGVCVEAASASRAIDQSSTIGFSAGLDYATSRTETFMAYLTGKKRLMRDRFSGSTGFYIYEEMPDLSKRSGITGKGIEGFTDAILKVFGV